MANQNTIIILASLLIGSVALYLTLRKWRCVEGECEQSIFGKHSTKDECEKSCINPEKAVRFSDDVSYICDTDHNCVPVQGKNTGTYTTESECEKNCGNILDTNYYNYPYSYNYYPYYWYYPQSLYYNTRRYYRPFPNRIRRGYYPRRGIKPGGLRGSRPRFRGGGIGRRGVSPRGGGGARGGGARGGGGGGARGGGSGARGGGGSGQ